MTVDEVQLLQRLMEELRTVAANQKALTEEVKKLEAKVVAAERSTIDLSTTKKLIGGIFVLLVPALIVGTVMAIRNDTQQTQLERDVAQHAQALEVQRSSMAQLSGDVRVIAERLDTRERDQHEIESLERQVRDLQTRTNEPPRRPR